MEDYCKYTLVLVRSTRKTANISKTRVLFQKNSFFKISGKRNYLHKLEIWRFLTRKCHIFRLTNHYFEEEKIWDIFEKSSFSQKRQYPSLTNFPDFEKIQIARNHIEMEGYCKYRLVLMRSTRKTAKISKTRVLLKKNSFFKISGKWNYLHK
jgi:hypothetical protein